MRTSKLTKDEPEATVTYPDDVAGPVTIKVTGGDEPFTKKITFKKGDGGDETPPDDGDGDDGTNPPDDGDGGDDSGAFDAKIEQDPSNKRKVTVTLTKVPDTGGGDGDAGEGEPSNGKPGNEGGTQGTGASTADQTGPKKRAAADDGESGDESGGGTASVEWGGKTKGKAPTELTVDEPVTVEYAAEVTKATITIDDDDDSTDPFTKGLKFGPAPEPDGDIVVDAQQDKDNPRKVTFTLKKAPESGGDDGGGESDNSNSSGEKKA